MTFGWPQIIYVAILAMALSRAIHNHGKPKTDEKHNAGAMLIAIGLTVGLLYWGGFFGS